MTTIPLKRIEVQFSGNVQGVGFRYSTERIAQGFDVTGFVQNLDNGTVLLVAEGTAVELQRFQETLADELSQFIQSQQQQAKKATLEFSKFSIRR